MRSCPVDCWLCQRIYGNENEVNEEMDDMRNGFFNGHHFFFAVNGQMLRGGKNGVQKLFDDWAYINTDFSERKSTNDLPPRGQGRKEEKVSNKGLILY
ncbi:putative succinate-semialdehyde dehydrogenase [Dirofilaria immitis]